MFVPPFGYLRSFKSDFDAVKSIVGLLNEQIKTGYSVHSPLLVFVPPSVSVPPLTISGVSSRILML